MQQNLWVIDITIDIAIIIIISINICMFILIIKTILNLFKSILNSLFLHTI